MAADYNQIGFWNLELGLVNCHADSALAEKKSFLVIPVGRSEAKISTSILAR